MKTLTYGILPDKAELIASLNDESYDMTLVGDDAEAAIAAINQGIDSHLETVRFTQYQAGHKLGLQIEPESMPVLLRRLVESDDEISLDLASSILYTLDFEWI